MSKIPALEVEHVRKNFGTLQAVNDVSFTIEEGEMFALLGPNGAGKSTTIHMITGIARLSGGAIRVFGHDVQSDYVDSRRLTGVMHQEIVADNFFTVEQGLKIHAGYYGRRDDPAWRSVLIERLALGPHLKKKPIQLSGGTKRRLMLAKALIHKPRLLILDEPTAGVDVELRHSLWEFVRDINRKGTTLLLTTHYLEEAQEMCNRVAIMNKGQLVALESMQTLLGQLADRKLVLHFQQPPSEWPASFEALGAQRIGNADGIQFPINDDHAIDRVLKAVHEARLTLIDIETRRADLEDVFLKLTGAQK